MNTVAVERQIQDFREHFLKVSEEISRVIVGNEAIISGVMTCLLARGHVLLEGSPGFSSRRI
jgi:MoxR-like ATPase